MDKIRCIAIDDEPLALAIIEQFCERAGDLEITVFSECQQGLDAIWVTRPDIVFLDVEMNDVNGLELAEKLPPGTCLIFTTAHSQYALDGFNLDAVDFLFKPFSYDRFQQAVQKAVRRKKSQLPEELTGTVTVVQEYNKVTIPLKEIVYVEAMGNYAKIYCSSGECILSHSNMKALQQQLPPAWFLRIHRSFIISLSYVQCYSTSRICLRFRDKVLPIGMQYQKEVLERISSSGRSW